MTSFEQDFEGLLLMPTRRDLRELLEVRKERQRDVGAHVGHPEFAGHEPKVFGRSGATNGAAVDDAQRLVVPLGLEIVDRDLQRARG
jgi:hypothetical protein